MNVITKPGLLKLAKKHPETLATLGLWYKAARKAEWRGLHEVRLDFPSADQIGGLLVFDILGNNYRLIAGANYSRQQLFIKELLTHGEYDRKGWMKWV